jgi:hypothetical protein
VGKVARKKKKKKKKKNHNGKKKRQKRMFHPELGGAWKRTLSNVAP